MLDVKLLFPSSIESNGYAPSRVVVEIVPKVGARVSHLNYTLKRSRGRRQCGLKTHETPHVLTHGMEGVGACGTAVAVVCRSFPRQVITTILLLLIKAIDENRSYRLLSSSSSSTS